MESYDGKQVHQGEVEVRQVQEMTDFPAEVQKAASGFAEMKAEADKRTRA